MWTARALALGALAAALGCGDGTTEPPEVTFGETTFVVIVNPTVNDDNDLVLPPTGTSRAGVVVSLDEGPPATTDAAGIAVLAPVPAGTRVLSLSGSGESGQLTLTIEEGDLREVAVALTADGAAVMTNVRYPFGGQVIEVTPSTPIAEVNEALAMSNVIVFFRGGVYSAELLEFQGSNVTLFGEGERGGTVTLNANVTVGGSSNRIRGARVTGSVSVPGSDGGIAFGRFEGAFDVSGSSSVLVLNGFCGAVTLGGSNATAIGNAGLPPVPEPADCP